MLAGLSFKPPSFPCSLAFSPEPSYYKRRKSTLSHGTFDLSHKPGAQATESGLQ